MQEQMSTDDYSRDAVRRKIPYFIAYGSEEAAKKSVRLKELATGKEEELSQDIVMQHIYTKEQNS